MATTIDPKASALELSERLQAGNLIDWRHASDLLRAIADRKRVRN